MAVYVDPASHAYGRMIMCHMWADTLPELLAMVDMIEVPRKWIQGHPELSLPRYRKASWVHFDISSLKRAFAVRFGAISTDKYGPLVWQCEQILSSDADEERKMVARTKLLMIAGHRNRGVIV